jgi:hypothetical protein
MLITMNTHKLWPEAAPVATAAPCPYTLADERRSGDNPTLAERCAR